MNHSLIKIGYIFRIFIILFCLVTSLVYVPINDAYAEVNGIDDGTYDFGGVVGDENSAEPGFATFSDKFIISNGFMVDPGTTQLYSTNFDGDAETLIIKTTGGKTFTFKDLGISIYYDNPILTMANFSIILKGINGNIIYSETKSNFNLDNEGEITQLSTLFNDGIQFNYDKVASLEFNWQFAEVAPSNLNFENITISNVSAPPTVQNGIISSSNVTSTGVTLDWTEATDDNTLQEDLEYQIYQSSSNNIDSISNIEANGTALGSGYTKDLTTYNVTGLSPSTTYYFNVVVRDTTGDKTVYTMKEVTTSSPLTAPTVTTNTASNETSTGATVGGNVTSDGGATITERGVVYGTSANPTTSDSKEPVSGTTGDFTAKLSKLSPDTTYHYRAYATNSEGTSYGSDKTFTTASLSNNANLSNLTLSSGTLSPEFASGTEEYTLSVANSVEKIKVTPTIADSKATVKVNDAPVTSGSASADIPLTVGENEITVVVTAEDTSTKTYTITVTRAASSNADLSSLTFSAGTLSPEFASGITDYTVSVENSITSVSMTPTVADSKATVTVNGALVTSGEASTDIQLTVGSNEITIIVTAQNGDTKTYKITVTRAASSNADLSSLTLSAGTLSPEFASGITDYTVSVENSITSVSMTPTVADSMATVTVNGALVTSGEASTDIQLTVGSNEITIIVTAQNGDTKTYKITVTRAASSNANLSDLTLSTGTLSPEFASSTTDYTVSVENSITSLNVTPTVADSAATVTVNGVTVTSGNTSTDIPLTVGTNEITIVVTAQDTSTKTYTIGITRSAPKTYTVTYDGNGATKGTVPKDNQTYIESASVTVLDNIGKLMIPSYKFTGWNTKADGTGTTYLPNDKFTMGTDNIVLYAKWTSNRPSNSNGSSSSGTKRPADIGNGTGNSSYAQVDIVRTIKGNKKIDQVELDKTTINKALMGALEQKQDFISIRISDLPSDPADEVVITLPKEPLSQLSTSHSALEIKTDDVSIRLPKESIQGLSEKNELFFRVVPIREGTEQQDVFETTLKAEVVKQIAGDKEVQVLGKPMTIETNYQGLNTTVTFSLKDLTLPINQSEREKFLKSLAVFIEHSDGEKVVQRGKVKYDTSGEPVGLEIEITKFSTFTFIGLPESDFDGQEMEASEKVMPDKVWTITFNTSINPSTISNNSVYVQDANGNNVDVNVKLVNSKTIQVIPMDDYESNQTYYLYITKEILSTAGKPLSESYRMTFTIDNQSEEDEK